MNKNKNPFLCVSNNEISFGSSRHREEALSSPFLHTDVYTIHAYIHTELHFLYLCTPTEERHYKKQHYEKMESTLSIHAGVQNKYVQKVTALKWISQL